MVDAVPLSNLEQARRAYDSVVALGRGADEEERYANTDGLTAWR